LSFIFHPSKKRFATPRFRKMPALDFNEDNNTTTRLLTLLNVSALKNSKRKRTDSIEPTPRVILNKRRSVQLDTAESTPAASEGVEGEPETPLPDTTTGAVEAAAVVEDVEDDHGTYEMNRCKLRLS
jgi:U3 small nucleolar RNA-associated protein 25